MPCILVLNVLAASSLGALPPLRVGPDPQSSNDGAYLARIIHKAHEIDLNWEATVIGNISNLKVARPKIGALGEAFQRAFSLTQFNQVFKGPNRAAGEKLKMAFLAVKSKCGARLTAYDRLLAGGIENSELVYKYLDASKSHLDSVFELTRLSESRMREADLQILLDDFVLAGVSLRRYGIYLDRGARTPVTVRVALTRTGLKKGDVIVALSNAKSGPLYPVRSLIDVFKATASEEDENTLLAYRFKRAGVTKTVTARPLY